MDRNFERKSVSNLEKLHETEELQKKSVARVAVEKLIESTKEKLKDQPNPEMERIDALVQKLNRKGK